MIKLVILLTLLVSVLGVNVTKINSHWEMEIVDTTDEHKDLLNQKFETNVPSTLHLDLMKHGKL